MGGGRWWRYGVREEVEVEVWGEGRRWRYGGEGGEGGGMGRRWWRYGGVRVGVEAR